MTRKVSIAGTDSSRSCETACPAGGRAGVEGECTLTRRASFQSMPERGGPICVRMVGIKARILVRRFEKRLDSNLCGSSLAVGVGFEPTEPLGSLVFKTRAFGHSATPPDPGLRRPAVYARAHSAVVGAEGGPPLNDASAAAAAHRSTYRRRCPCERACSPGSMQPRTPSPTPARTNPSRKGCRPPEPANARRRIPRRA